MIFSKQSKNYIKLQFNTDLMDLYEFNETTLILKILIFYQMHFHNIFRFRAKANGILTSHIFRINIKGNRFLSGRVFMPGFQAKFCEESTSTERLRSVIFNDFF